jgi:hypothetical protein
VLAERKFFVSIIFVLPSLLCFMRGRLGSSIKIVLLSHSSNAKKKIVCSIGIVYKDIGSYIQIPMYHNLEQVRCLWCGCGMSKVIL